ncbi:hypothetical protein [Gallaecimonas pentaromativorans]|uniref:hypothetical protein n=1 Tax=Gallaecimonas pentaromativorans TaxID=584787 RepID=UPI003A91EDEE
MTTLKARLRFQPSSSVSPSAIRGHYLSQMLALALFTGLVIAWVAYDIHSRIRQAGQMTLAQINALPAPAAGLPTGLSPSDSSSLALVKYVKGHMDNPASFVHIITDYEDHYPDYYLVTMTYGEGNDQGKVVTRHIEAKMDTDGDLMQVTAYW